jgi:hypothetical protein
VTRIKVAGTDVPATPPKYQYRTRISNSRHTCSSYASTPECYIKLIATTSNSLSKSILCLPRPSRLQRFPSSRSPLLCSPTLQPLRQRICKQLPTNLTSLHAQARPKIITMLRIPQRVPKYLTPRRLPPTFGYLLCDAHIGRIGR